MKNLLALIFLISSFLIFSQNRTELDFEIDNPFPRVGQEVKLTLRFDALREKIDKRILGEGFEPSNQFIFDTPYPSPHPSKAVYEVKKTFDHEGWNTIPSSWFRIEGKQYITKKKRIWVDPSLRKTGIGAWFRYRKIDGKYYGVLEQKVISRPIFPEVKREPVDYNEPLGPVPNPIAAIGDSTKYFSLIRNESAYELRAVGYAADEHYSIRNLVYKSELFEIIFHQDSFLIDSSSFNIPPPNFQPIWVVKKRMVKVKPVLKRRCLDYKYEFMNAVNSETFEEVYPDINGYFDFEVGGKYYLIGNDRLYGQSPENSSYGFVVPLNSQDSIIQEINYSIGMKKDKKFKGKYLYRDCDDVPLNGYHEFYSYDDHLLMRGSFENGENKDTLYYYNFGDSLPSSALVKISKKKIHTLTFYSNGNLREVIENSPGDSKHLMFYFENGQPKYSGVINENSYGAFPDRFRFEYYSNGQVKYELGNDTLFHYLEIGKLRYTLTIKIVHEGKNLNWLRQYTFYDQNGKKEVEIYFDSDWRSSNFQVMNSNLVKYYVGGFKGAFFYSAGIIYKKHEIIEDGVGTKTFITKVRKGDTWKIEFMSNKNIEQSLEKALKHYFE